MIIKTWSDAQHKLNEIFSNNKKTRGTIRGELLKKSEQDRLDYFVGDNEEIESALLTLLPDENRDYRRIESRIKKIEDENQDYRRIESRVEKIETQLKEESSVVFSRIDFDKMQQIKEHLKIDFIVVNWKTETDNQLHFPKFKWNSKVTEDAQFEEYSKYLKDNINLPDDLEWYNAKNNRRFLNLTNQKWFPFSLKGTTDVAILNKGYSKRLGQEVAGCKVIIELKKPSNIDSMSRFQTEGELISANHWSNYDVLAILTDLNDSWEFFWEFDNQIRSFKPETHQHALQILQIYVDNVESGFNCFTEDFPLSKRRKLNTTNVQISDVANFDDFANEMTDAELKKKNIDRYLQEVYINSTSFQQFEMNDKLNYYV